jgi:putative copper resistance protein D
MTAAGPETRAISPPSAPGSWLTPWQRKAGYVVVLAGAGVAGLAFGQWDDGRTRPVDVASVDPGVLTRWGLPAVKLAVVVAVVGTIGMLVATVLLPRKDGAFDPAARRCLRSAGRLAVAWAVGMVALLVLSWSDTARVPVIKATIFQIFSGPQRSPDAIPYLYGAGLALIIAAGAYITRTATGVVVVLLLCAYNTLPLTARGQQVHSSIIGAVVTVHVLAIAVWVGSLAGLLVHTRRSPALLAVAVPRFGRLALACFVVVGAFGLTAAWINLGSLHAVGTSHFGTLVLYKTEALIALGVFGWWQRRRTIPQVTKQRDPRPFVRFAAIEVVIMAAAIGLGIALSSTPAPALPPPPPPKPNPYSGATVSLPLPHPPMTGGTVIVGL